MIDTRLDHVLAGPRLPSLPAVAVRVLQLAERPDTTLQQVAEAIEFDQALSARLLRTVNSSFYGLARPCGNIEQALAYLGLKAVRSLVLGFSLARSLDGGGTEDVDFPWRAYWRRVIFTAATARMLSSQARRGDPDESQVAALLADMGMVALYRAYGDRYLQTIDLVGHDHASLAEAEGRILGLTHADVSAEMARRWNLPPTLVDALQHHHIRPDSGNAPETLVVGVAVLAARAMEAADARHRAEAEAAFVRSCGDGLALTPQAAERLLNAAFRAASELSQCLELDVGRPYDPGALSERAAAARKSIGQDDSTTSEADGSDTFEDVLGRAFESGDGQAVGLAVFEADRTRRAEQRLVGSQMAMARLEQELRQGLAGAALHQLSDGAFAAVFRIPATPAAEAGLVRTVESTRREVAARRFNMGADGFLTVSAGVAVHGRRRFGSPEALLRAAMLALQSAQREGRNRVGHYRAGYDPLAA